MISSWTTRGVAVAFKLLERVRELEEEIARLRARDCPVDEMCFAPQLGSFRTHSRRRDMSVTQTKRKGPNS